MVHELEGVLRFERARAGGILVECPRLVMSGEGEWIEQGAYLLDWLRFVGATDRHIKLTLEVLD